MLESIYIVCKESESLNIAAFISYELAEKYINLLGLSEEERQDYYIDELRLYHV